MIFLLSEHESVDKAALRNVDASFIPTDTGGASAVTSLAAATAGFSPLRVGLCEGLEFCRDGEILLQQLHQRILAIAEQLAAAGCARAFSECNNGVEIVDTEGKFKAGPAQSREQQQILEDEVDKCLVEIR